MSPSTFNFIQDILAEMTDLEYKMERSLSMGLEVDWLELEKQIPLGTLVGDAD